MATFKSYRDEKTGNMLWGCAITGAARADAYAGKSIDVTKRNGKTKTITLDRLLSEHSEYSLWAIVGAKPAKRRGYPTKLDGKCKTCSKAIPSKYTQCLACKDRDAAGKRVESGETEREQRSRQAADRARYLAHCEAEDSAESPFPAW